jgi:hypothetical protein
MRRPNYLSAPKDITLRPLVNQLNGLLAAIGAFPSDVTQGRGHHCWHFQWNHAVSQLVAGGLSQLLAKAVVLQLPVFFGSVGPDNS